MGGAFGAQKPVRIDDSVQKPNSPSSSSSGECANCRYRSNSNGESAPMLRAAYNNHPTCITALAGRGENVNYANKDGATAVYIAAEHGYTNCIQTLAQHNANLNTQNNGGATPIYVAAQNGHRDAIIALLELKADPSIRAKDGFTPILIASENGQNNCIKTLIECKCNPNESSNEGITPVFAAAAKGQISTINVLTDGGADVNISMKNGASPIFIAAKNGHDLCIQRLLELSADPNQPMKDGTTAIIIAATTGHAQCIKVLADADADVNRTNNNGSTALHEAVFQGFEDCIKVLLERGALLTIQDNKGRLPINLATPSVAALLEPVLPYLLDAIRCGDQDQLNKLLDEGANPNQSDHQGWTPLMEAAVFLRTEMVNILVNKGADPNYTDVNGFTVLLWANWCGNSALLSLLKDLGLHLNAKEKEGLERLKKSCQNNQNTQLLTWNQDQISILANMPARRGQDRIVGEGSKALKERMNDPVHTPISSDESYRPSMSLYEFLKQTGENEKLWTVRDDINDPNPPMETILWEGQLSIVRSVAKGDPLDPNHMMSLYAYTYESDLYRCVNRAMRQRDTHTIAEWQPFIYYVSRALEALPSCSVDTFRGIAMKLDPNIYSVGMEVEWAAFTSTSTKWKVANGFLSEEGSGVVFLIHGISGKSIQRYSYYPHEAEVLFAPNRKFKVMKWSKASVDTMLFEEWRNHWSSNITIEELPNVSSLLVEMEELPSRANIMMVESINL